VSTDQYQQNISTVTTMLQTADSALSSIVTQVTNAISLGVEGANGTESDTDQQTLAQNVQGIANQVLQAANTSVSGSYVFAGTATTTAPFTMDPTTSAVTYNGNSSTNSVPIGDGQNVTVNVPGSQLFLNSGANIFGSLQQLVSALQSGNQTDIGNATTQLQSALSYLNEQRTFYGDTENQLNSQGTYLQQVTVNLQTQQNNLVGANISTVASDLTQSQTAYTAAVSALAKVMSTNLLDYLPQ
jgi:flagellar hook-associated protein 3 FlgL